MTNDERGPMADLLVPFATRVCAAPHTDVFMQGERFGTVRKVGRRWVHVNMERSGRVRKFFIDDEGRAPGLRVVS